MDEATIRAQVYSRHIELNAKVNWLTPAGNMRSAPVYEVVVRNDYLRQIRTLRANSSAELQTKADACLNTWAEQEIRKRVIEAKQNTKEQAQAEAERLDLAAKHDIARAEGLLAATLSVDDRIDWDARRDTRTFPPFAFRPPPNPPAPNELLLPDKPGFTWLLRWRLTRWTRACEELSAWHAAEEQQAQQRYQAALEQYNADRAAAESQHAQGKQTFLQEQARFNDSLAAFRRRFEASEIEAIKEYCLWVLEQSSYPDFISLSYDVGYDEVTGYVTVDVELPSRQQVPTVAGYKFVARGNRVDPIPLKKREADALYASILDQIMIRTAHEVLEGCYVATVRGVLVNGWVTELDKATGQDVRARSRTIMTDRAQFEGLDLSRVDPASCMRLLSEAVGQMDGRR